MSISFIEPIWGIDLGPARIEGLILADKEDKSPLRKMSIPTEAHMGYRHVLEQISRIVEVLTAETGLKPGIIGVSTSGVLDPDSQTIKNSETECLNGHHLKRDLEIFLGVPIKLANHTKCRLLAEAQFGVIKEQAPKAKVIVGLFLGYTVRGGILIEGKILEGLHGIAGDWGHTYLDESGGRCHCGKVGCVDTLLSKESLEVFYASIRGARIPIQEVMKRHEAGDDVAARKTVHRLLHYFGKGVAQVINLLDPDVILLGGPVGRLEILTQEGMEDVGSHIHNNEIRTQFLNPCLGGSSGVLGAALISGQVNIMR